MERSLMAVFAIVGAITLSGCGVETLKNFSCSNADFNSIEEKAGKLLGNQPTITRNDESSYLFAKEVNEKIADKCSLPLRKTCSNGHENVKRTSHAVTGPVNSFGVEASTDIREVPSVDGLARGWEPKVFYKTTIESTLFHKTLSCYQANTK